MALSQTADMSQAEGGNRTKSPVCVAGRLVVAWQTEWTIAGVRSLGKTEERTRQ